jgi:hypothetical protein
MDWRPDDARFDRVRRLLAGDDPLPRSIEEYLDTRQTDLAGELQKRTPIYLDTRVWIDLRKANEHGLGHPAYGLLNSLREAAKGGRAFCPLSASSFSEVLQHSATEVRIATARLIDELSLGVGLVSFEELMSSEIRWLLNQCSDTRLDPEVVPLWTRLSYTLGGVVPIIPSLSERELLAIQVGSLDTLWEMGLEEMAQGLAFQRHDRRAQAEQITHDIRAHAQEASDYDGLYKSEARGMAEVAAPICATIAREMEGGPTPSQFPLTNAEIQRWSMLLFGALVQDKGRHALRSMHVRAAWHAIARRNKGRAFKPNDFIDIEHAASGVGYCGAFFSESSLCTALTQPPVSLDRLYGCYITNDFVAAESFVRQLDAS